MKYLAVTTFNAEGLELYGRRMAETFVEHWPDEVQLRIYAEGFETRPLTFNLMALSSWLMLFKARNAGRPFQGFRHDAIRFAHKIAALTHAANEDIDYLIWADGDIVTHSDVTEADILDWLPVGDEWIAWLDRNGNYPECGFYILNCRHPRHEEMISCLVAMYAEDLLFELPEWHDSYVLQHVVEQSGVKTKSLSGEARSTSHPLVNSGLGAFIDHLKGSRKKSGKSRKSDLVAPRQETYWQET